MQLSNKFKPTTQLFLVVITAFLAACSTSPPAVEVGSPAPEFNLPTADGGSVALKEFVGQQPVLLYFHMAVG
jgi:hypothetical protein